MAKQLIILFCLISSTVLRSSKPQLRIENMHFWLSMWICSIVFLSLTSHKEDPVSHIFLQIGSQSTRSSSCHQILNKSTDGFTPFCPVGGGEGGGVGGGGVGEGRGGGGGGGNEGEMCNICMSSVIRSSMQ